VGPEKVRDAPEREEVVKELTPGQKELQGKISPKRENIADSSKGRFA